MSLQKKTEKPAAKKIASAKDQSQPSKYSPAQIKQFGGEVRNEFNKIVWPTRKHTIGSTVVVTIFVTIIAIYLGAVDLILGKLIGLAFK